MENILNKTIKLNYQNQSNIKGEIEEEKMLESTLINMLNS
jgi:hypothetical protein